MRRFLYILPVILLLGLSFGVAAPVAAQETCTNFSFEGPTLPADIELGTGTTFTANTGVRNPSGNTTVYWNSPAGEDITLSEAAMTWQGSGVAGQSIYISKYLDTVHTYLIFNLENQPAGRQTDTWEGTTTADSVRFIVEPASNNWIYAIRICETTEDPGEIGRPFKSSDEDAWGFYQHGDHEAVVAFSGERGDFVHAGFSGTVTVVDDTLGIARCSDTLRTALTAGCDLYLPDEVTGFGIVSLYKIGSRIFNNFIFQYVPGAGRVVIQSASDPDVTLTYFVNNPSAYVEEGATISEGCVIGKSVNFIGLSPGDLFSIGQPNDRGVVVMQMHDDSAVTPLIDEFKDTYPSNDTPCNTPPDYQDCYGGSTLDHPENWNVSNGASIDNPGATLGRFSNITYTSPFNLNELRNPRMRVNARATGGTAQMELTMGQASETFEVSTGDYLDYLLSGTAIEGDIAGSLYTIRIANNSDATINIRYICISHELDEELELEPDPPPPVCYFVNPSFVNGLDGWDHDAGVTPGNSGGEIHVESGDSFWQSVHLFPGDYTIRVRSGLRYYVAYSPDETEDTDNLEFDYVYDALDESMGVATFGQLASANNSYEFLDTFNVASETTANFVFTPTLTTSDGSVVGAAIRDVCLYAGDDPDNPWPGHDPVTEPQPGPFEETCDPLSMPQGNSIGPWIAWHWHELNQFFQCDLMVLLNRMYDLINRFFQLIGNVMRWMMLNIQLSINWVADQVLPWLGGYFANMGGGGVYADVSASPGSGCAPWDLICHLRNVVEDIFSTVRDAIFDIAEWLFSAISTVINAIFSFVQSAWNILQSILGTIINILGIIIGKLVELIEKTVGVAVLAALAFLGFVFTVGVGIATTVIAGVISAITSILAMLFFVLGLIVTLIIAWNTAPTLTIDVLTCEGNPITDSLCWIWWVLDNTLFAPGQPGAAIVPVLIAIAVVGLIIRFVTTIRKTFITTAAQTA